MEVIRCDYVAANNCVNILLRFGVGGCVRLEVVEVEKYFRSWNTSPL
jgi:hypothetical protein